MNTATKIKDFKTALEAQSLDREKPHGWIQWKGTDVCMDVRCECGARGHIDAEFAYQVKCCVCGKVYAVSGYVELLEVEECGSDVCTVEF